MSNYKCPRCGDGGMVVEAIQRITAYINEEGDVYDEDGGDTEWEDVSNARCHDCGFSGNAQDFLNNDRG